MSFSVLRIRLPCPRVKKKKKAAVSTMAVFVMYGATHHTVRSPNNRHPSHPPPTSSNFSQPCLCCLFLPTRTIAPSGRYRRAGPKTQYRYGSWVGTITISHNPTQTMSFPGTRVVAQSVQPVLRGPIQAVVSCHKAQLYARRFAATTFAGKARGPENLMALRLDPE